MVRAGASASGAAARADAPARALPRRPGTAGEVGGGGRSGWRVRVAVSECECARASGRESGSHSSEAHTDMFDRRDMTRASEEAAAGAGPRAPARA